MSEFQLALKWLECGEKPDLLDKHGQEKGDSLAFATGGIWQINHWFPTDPAGPMGDNFSNTHIAADFCVSQNPCKL